MQFLCDVHISFKIKRLLIDSGFSCSHINEILKGDITSDADIAEYCNEHNLILISKDQDFTDSYLISKKPRKFIKISLGNISTNHLIELLKTSFSVLKELNNRDFFMLEFHRHSIQVWED